MPEVSEIESGHIEKKLKLSDENESKIAARPQGITEPDVGISQYIASSVPGFKGILKQRYTDFLVNEITEDGSVLHLIDLGLLNKKERRLEKREQERLNVGGGSEESLLKEEKPIEENIPEENLETSDKLLDKSSEISVPAPSEHQAQQLVDIFGSDIAVQIEQLFKKEIAQIESAQAFNDKGKRGAIHQLLREAYKSQLETKTTAENKFVLTLSSMSNSSRRKSKVDKREIADGRKPDHKFLHFTLYKENKDTMEVASLISRFLRVHSRAVTFAGTKDRRGVTVQRACISNINVERLNGLNKTLRGVKFGGFKYEKDALKLGSLLGNEFVITIKDVKGESSTNENILARVESLRAKGFINYYGMQRFGTFSISTHSIGIPLLKNEWEAAVNLLLDPQEFSTEDSSEARKVWYETRDAAKALELMPKKCVAESCVLKNLVKDPKGYANAIAQIPRNLRIMYVHAYQSYVWNAVVSKRIELYGLKVVAGDLVIEDKKLDTAASQIEDEEYGYEDIKASKDANIVRARLVTEQDLESKTIYDVVLPTPGFDIIYPDNELKHVYEEIMAKDGLNYLEMRRNVKDFSLSGSYRHIVAKPEHVETWIKHYEADTEQFVRTDLELIEKGLTINDQVIGDSGEGSKTAVVLRMRLKTSQYATMALRELMKIDTSRRGEGYFV